MTKQWFYLMSLVLFITVSSFFLPRFLTYLLDHNTQNKAVLSVSKSLTLSAYFHHQRRNAIVGSAVWLKNSVALLDESPQLTIEIADYYLKEKQRVKAIFWYQQAIKYGLDNARHTLASLYYQQQNYQQAKAVLTPILSVKANDSIESSLVLLIHIALLEGDIVEATRLTAELSLLNQHHELLDELNKYQVFTQDKLEHKIATNKHLSDVDFPASEIKACETSLQFYATNLHDLRYITGLIKQVKLRPLSKYICFTQVRYIPLPTLGCSHDKDEAITCNEAVWHSYKNQIDTRFIGVMVPNGGAKVHNGILYLDNKDTVAVFAHELAHLLGFIDEYSLPTNHSRCLKPQDKTFAHNIAVLPKVYHGDKQEIRNKVLMQLPWRAFIKSETPILTKQDNAWLLGTPKVFQGEVGVFESDTCQKASSDLTNNIQAYKPLTKRTSLNYFELKFPALYQRLLEKETRKFLMPSFHRNIEKALNRAH